MDFYTQIDDFVNDHLSKNDRVLFIAEMNRDPQLRKAVENHDIVTEALDLLLEDDIRNTIKNLDQEEVPQTSPPVPGIITFLKIAAVMAGLALIGFLINRSKKPTPEIIYATFYSEYIGPTYRGGSDEVNDLSKCELGHYYLQNERFTEATAVLQVAAAVTNECTDKAQWYLTLIYLHQENTESRDSLLNIVLSNPQSAYRDQAERLLQVLE